MSEKLEWNREQKEEKNNIWRFYKIDGYTLGIGVKKREKFDEWAVDLFSTDRTTHQMRRIETFDNREDAKEKAEWFMNNTNADISDENKFFTAMLVGGGLFSVIFFPPGFLLTLWGFNRVFKYKTEFHWADERGEA